MKKMHHSKSPQFSSKTRVIHLKPKEILFHEGEASESMYIIQSGLLVIKKKNQHRDTILSQLGPKQLVGEMGFFKNQPRTASAEAITNTSVIELPFHTLHQEFESFPEWIKILIKTIRERLKVTNEKLCAFDASYPRSHESKKNPAFSHQLLKPLILLNLLSQHHLHIKKEDNVSLFHLKTLKDYAHFSFEILPEKIESLLSIFSNIGILVRETRSDELEVIKILDPSHLNHFVHWYEGQTKLKETKQISIEKERIHLLESLILLAKDQDHETGSHVTVTADFKHETKANEHFKAFKEQSLIKAAEERENSEFSITFSPDRLTKILSFCQILLEIQSSSPGSLKT